MGDLKCFDVWITKYALTKGIFKLHVEECPDSSDNMVAEILDSYRNWFHKPEWHRTREEAVAQADKMRRAKIASLRKQVAKLEALSFS